MTRVKMPKIWEILKTFKLACRHRGWATCEDEDWVEVGDDYHNFLSAGDVHPSSFKRITSNRKCVIREGLSYRVVKASYTAWLLSEPPSETVVKTVIENPDFSSRVALYDLSPMLEGKNLCAKLNLTESPVFQEFERYLTDKLKLKFELLSPSYDSGISPHDYTTAQLA